MRETLVLVIGYLLGSVLPADLLARRRGVDIRAVGTRNPGATNALHELGVVPGLLVGAYDASVGLVAMYVAHALGLSHGWMYAAAVAAIVGHRFPIFFRFRGGQGMAATTGVLVFELGIALTRGWLSVFDLALLAVGAAVVFVLTRSATLVGVITVPLLIAETILGPADRQFAAFLTLLALYIWVVQIGIARENHLFARLRHPRLSSAQSVRQK